MPEDAAYDFVLALSREGVHPFLSTQFPFVVKLNDYPLTSQDMAQAEYWAFENLGFRVFEFWLKPDFETVEVMLTKRAERRWAYYGADFYFRDLVDATAFKLAVI